jgi:hypothetical protein
MSQIVIAADNATLILNGLPVTDLAEGDYITMTPVNPLTSRVNSANGGVNIAKRFDGDVYDMTVRVQRESDSDVFLNNAVRQDVPVLIEGSLKEAYLKDGNPAVESWQLESGSITTQPTETKNNTDGNSVMEYTIQFRSAKRNLG